MGWSLLNRKLVVCPVTKFHWKTSVVPFPLKSPDIEIAASGTVIPTGTCCELNVSLRMFQIRFWSVVKVQPKDVAKTVAVIVERGCHDRYSLDRLFHR